MCSCQGAGQANEIATISGGNDGEVPPVPIRTQKISSPGSKILGWRRPGKIERRRYKQSESSFYTGFLTYIPPDLSEEDIPP